jgi:hypothetical protein
MFAADWQVVGIGLFEHGSLQRSNGGAETTDFFVEHTMVVGIVDGQFDEMHATFVERALSMWVSSRRRSRAMAVRAMRFGKFYEVGIAELHAEIGITHIGLFPADHAEGVVAQ